MAIIGGRRGSERWAAEGYIANKKNARPIRAGVFFNDHPQLAPWLPTELHLDEHQEYGRGGWIRTNAWQDQNLLPYRLATPLYLRLKAP